MPKICYQQKRFTPESMAVIENAVSIIEEYRQAGYDLTLRQLYYQFVARGLIPNKDKEYKRLGIIVSDARMAGLIDWLAIVDRTRYLRKNPHWSDPAAIIEAAAQSYARDKWQSQDMRLEVWIEKDALVGVIARVCEQWDVPYFSCRGYTSMSEMWIAGRRLLRNQDVDQHSIILHLGDHDPSGIDMSRDIQERLELFTGGRVRLERLALNMDQVQQYNPPPNPAKITDSRFAHYVRTYGHDSWELDALDPKVLFTLVETAIHKFRDRPMWDYECQEEEKERKQLHYVVRSWERIKNEYRVFGERGK